MQFLVQHGLNSYSNNALKSGDREAVRRQTQLEHDYLTDPKNLPEYHMIRSTLAAKKRAVDMMPPGPQKVAAESAYLAEYNAEMAKLKAKAELNERESPHYWDDATPRRPVAQSSSWVGDITYNPNANIVTIALGDKGKSRSKYATPKDAADWVDADSIGKKVNRELLGRV